MDFSTYKDCEGYSNLQAFSAEYGELICAGKAKENDADFVDFLHKKLEAVSEEKGLLLRLTSPNYEQKGFKVTGMTIEVFTKEALAHFVEGSKKHDLQLFTKPEGTKFRELKDRNGCGQSADLSR